MYALSEVVEPRYFDFDLPSNLIMDGREIKVKFRYDVKNLDMKSQKRLTVKPYISAGAVDIFNDPLNRFVGMADFISLLPYLREEMTLRFSGVQSSENSVSLRFVVSDVYTGKSYPTPTKKVWGTAYYKKYTDLLNENILKKPVEDGIVEEDYSDTVNSSKSGTRDPVRIYLWYLSPAFFLYGLLKSPNGFG